MCAKATNKDNTTKSGLHLRPRVQTFFFKKREMFGKLLTGYYDYSQVNSRYIFRFYAYPGPQENPDGSTWIWERRMNSDVVERPRFEYGDEENDVDDTIVSEVIKQALTDIKNRKAKEGETHSRKVWEDDQHREEQEGLEEDYWDSEYSEPEIGVVANRFIDKVGPDPVEPFVPVPSNVCSLPTPKSVYSSVNVVKSTIPDKWAEDARKTYEESLAINKTLQRQKEIDTELEKLRAVQQEKLAAYEEKYEDKRGGKSLWSAFIPRKK